MGHPLFAAGIIALGVICLRYGDSSLVLQAMPEWVPWRGDWIYACGTLMLVGGAGLFLARTAIHASRVLLVYLLLWLLLLKVPILVEAPRVIGSWETFAETATLLAGAWVIFAAIGGQGRSSWLKFVAGECGMRTPRNLFGIALILFGLAHFGYLKYTASLVPAWLPWHIGWVCLTGTGYMAAGLGTVFRIYPRLAAALTAGMMSVFQLLIWVPKTIDLPTDQSRWSELLVGWTLAAAAWVVADSYRGTAWLSIGKSSIVTADSGNETTV
ncbi:MAG: DoxX family membrane protein [Gammaproteobacteria bacterium]